MELGCRGEGRSPARAISGRAGVIIWLIYQLLFGDFWSQNLNTTYVRLIFFSHFDNGYCLSFSVGAICGWYFVVALVCVCVCRKGFVASFESWSTVQMVLCLCCQGFVYIEIALEIPRHRVCFLILSSVRVAVYYSLYGQSRTVPFLNRPI
jgi:hypothetical protein